MAIADFTTWLNGRLDPSEGEAAAFLKNLAGSGRLAGAADLAAGRTMLEHEAPAAVRDEVLASFDASVERYRVASSASVHAQEEPADPPAKPAVASVGQWIADRITLSGIVTGVIGIGMLAATFLFIWGDGNLVALADVDIARGLITFLFAVGTIGIAVLMICALFLSGETNLDARYDKAKEILTTLIAVLGTIVGFYFGSAGSGDPLAVPGIGAPVISPSPAKAGGTAQFVALANGRAPFNYKLDLRSDDAALDQELTDVSGESESGLIVETLALPMAATGKSILIDVTVTDVREQPTVLKGVELQVEPTP